MPKKPPVQTRQIDALLQIMADLRDPDGGCPWDLEQNFETIAPYTIEEAYEVADAIEHQDFDALKDELGDLLFQAVYHAQMAKEAGHFSFDDVVQNVCEKMIRRHPHVFSDKNILSADDQTQSWEQIKAAERAAKGEPQERERVLDGIPSALPSLTRAIKLQNRAARVGFDWPDSSHVIDKLNEEMLELSEEIRNSKDEQKIFEELGDLLFVYANLARHLKVDPEMSLRGANAKFERRFRFIEDRLAEIGKHASESDLDEMDALWDAAKEDERK